MSTHYMTRADEGGERTAVIEVEDGCVHVSTDLMEQLAQEVGATVQLNVLRSGDFPDSVVVAWDEMHEALTTLGFRDADDPTTEENA